MRFVAALLVAWLAACTAEGPLELALGAYAAAVADTSAALCRCPAAFGYGSVEACMRDPELGPLDDDARSCMHDALAAEPTAAIQLECMTAAERELARCLQSTPDCVDMPAAVYECVDRHGDALMRCEARAPAVEAAIAACTAAPRGELGGLLEG